MYFCLLKSNYYLKKLSKFNNFAIKNKKKVVMILQDNSNITSLYKNTLAEKYKDNIKIYFLEDLSNINKIEDIIKNNMPNNEDFFIIPWTSDSHCFIVNELYKRFWKNYSNNIDIYTNKSLLRDMLSKIMPEVTIDYFVFDPKLFDSELFKKIQKIIKFPFIIKPTKWATSRNVYLVNNYKELLNIINKISKIDKLFQIEEKISWNMFSIDFFVNNNWTPFFTYPLRVRTAKELWLYKDFSNILITNDHIDPVLLWNINDVFSELVYLLGMKNQFCHLEFFITKNNLIKIIEINWRQWGNRLDLYDIIYNWISVLDLTLNKDLLYYKQSKNIIFYKIYSFLERNKWSWHYNSIFFDSIKNILKENNWKIEYKLVNIKSWKERIWPADHNYTYPYTFVMSNNYWKDDNKENIINFINLNYNSFIW